MGVTCRRPRGRAQTAPLIHGPCAPKQAYAVTARPLRRRNVTAGGVEPGEVTMATMESRPATWVFVRGGTGLRYRRRDRWVKILQHCWKPLQALAGRPGDCAAAAKLLRRCSGAYKGKVANPGTPT